MSQGQLLAAQQWSDLAAARLHPHWLGQVWQSSTAALLLLDEGGEVVRLVAEAGDGPLDMLVAGGSAGWATLPRGSYAWRVGGQLWLGDVLTVQLPRTAPWATALAWQRPPATDEAVLARALAWLADWLLARAPDASVAGILPELLASAGAPGWEPDRPELALTPRLFRWRAARLLAALMPALERGDLAQAEAAVRNVAGLGPGAVPAGSALVQGLVAGMRLWPGFLHAGSGLRVEAQLQRLVRGATEHSSWLGEATLLMALAGHWGQRWQRLHAALAQPAPFADQQRAAVEQQAARWLEADPDGGSAALAGLLLPFLWYQRFLA